MVYRVVGSTMGNQGSTGYLVIQLSAVRAMPGLQHYTSCLFMWGCGLQLLEPYGLSWFSARGVIPWYRGMHGTFLKHMHYITSSCNNDKFV